MTTASNQITFAKEFSSTVSPDTIEPLSPTLTENCGASIEFLGVVREIEKGKKIRGIHYTAYENMANKILNQLHTEAESYFGEHRAHLQHRIGFVPVKEPSLRIRIITKHSAEAFSICQWYLKEIKTTVPIWKQPMFS